MGMFKKSKSRSGSMSDANGGLPPLGTIDGNSGGGSNSNDPNLNNSTSAESGSSAKNKGHRRTGSYSSNGSKRSFGVTSLTRNLSGRLNLKGGSTSKHSSMSSHSGDSKTDHHGGNGDDAAPPPAEEPPVDTEDVVPTMAMVPTLVGQLATAAKSGGDTASEVAARALRHLFALSEHSHDESNRNREELVHGGPLVPALLKFLRRCPRGSHEQYLALLVLNNVSIPAENKRVIAMDCGGAAALGRLLCTDPGCHLMVIVLVNLTFADSELRGELVDGGGGGGAGLGAGGADENGSPKSDGGVGSGVQLVDALSYAFKVANLTPEEGKSTQLPHLQLNAEGEVGKGNGKNASPNIPSAPRQLLAALTAYTDDANDLSRSPPFDPGRLLYPETGRWCLCALKNLTRPSSRDPAAVHAVMDAGIVPLILHIVSVSGGGANGSAQAPLPETVGGEASAMPSNENLNVPSKWDANSMQDAALFTVLNLAAVPDSRSCLREEDAVRVLSQIVQFGNGGDNDNLSEEARLVQQIQCLKARMALAYLCGGEGQFGQPRLRRNSSMLSKASTADPLADVLVIGSNEATQILRLLADTLHQRARDGAGGYSSATFTVKSVLFAIRCLLTKDENQKMFTGECGTKLNCLLLKALARHSIQGDMAIDDEAAEHACWSLYLLSNLGFKRPFLPVEFVEGEPLAEKTLTSYLHNESITAPGRHAADQILLRLAYLIFDGVVQGGDASSPASDFVFDGKLIAATQDIIVEKRTPGTAPQDEIFDRPILRSRAPRRGEQEGPWDNMDRVSEFPSAISAVQQLSFGSTKVRHMDAIDDVLIANNIASSANGLKTESYNYWWTWKDNLTMIQRNLSRRMSSTSSRIDQQPSADSSVLQKFIKKKIDSDDGPFSFFGLKCGAIGCTGDR